MFPDSPDLEIPLVPADADDGEAGGVHHHHHHLVSGPVPRPAPPAPDTVLGPPDHEWVPGGGGGLAGLLAAPYHHPVWLAGGGGGGGLIPLSDHIRVPGLLRGKMRRESENLVKRIFSSG